MKKFIQGNLRLVLSIVQKFSGRGENPDDLFQGELCSEYKYYGYKE